MNRFKVKNSNSRVNRVPTSFYMEKEYWIKLNNIKSLIFEEFDLRLPNTVLLNDAIRDFLLFNFNSQEDLGTSIEVKNRLQSIIVEGL